MSYIKINNDISLRYNSIGEGKPIIFLHGLGGRSMTFYHQVVALRKHYRCITLDLRGFGESTRLSDNHPCSIMTFVDDLKKVIEQLQLEKEKIILAGHSLGGMIALQFAISYPEQVEKLVIICSASSIKHSKLSSFGMALFPKAESLLKRESLKITYATKLNIYYKSATKELVDWLIGEAKKADENIIKTMSRVAQEIRRWNIDDELPKINIPTLIFRGEKDMLISKSSTDFLYKKIPNSKYVTIKKTGHCPLFEKPKIFNEVLINFLKNEPLRNLPQDIYIATKRDKN